MELYSLVISVLALIASVFTYLRHDKKLKEQERRINEYQLKQIEKEDLESKKAAIRGNIVKGLKGGRTLKVYNSGRATARNPNLGEVKRSQSNAKVSGTQNKQHCFCFYSRAATYLGRSQSEQGESRT